MTTALVKETEDLRYNYELIPDADREAVMEAAVEIKPRLKRAAEDIFAIGSSLLAVKDKIPHGQWLPWLETEFEMGEDTARNFMRVTERFSGKSGTIPDLTPTVLYLLARPSTPDAVVDQVARKAQSGERVTVATAKRAIEEAKPKPENLDHLKTRCMKCQRGVGWDSDIGAYCCQWCGHESSNARIWDREQLTAQATMNTANIGATQKQPALTSEQFRILREAISAWSFYIADKHPPVWHLTMALRPQTTIHDNMLHYLATHEVVVGSAEYIERATRDVLRDMQKLDPESATQPTEPNIGATNAEDAHLQKHQKIQATIQQSNQTAYEWLQTYVDAQGRNWQTLEDNQIHHASSACSNAFKGQHPEIVDPKSALRAAMGRLRSESQPQSAAESPAVRPLCKHCGKRAANITGKPYCRECWHGELTIPMYCPECNALSTIEKTITSDMLKECWACRKSSMILRWTEDRQETKPHTLNDGIREVWALIKQHTLSIDPADRLQVLETHKKDVFDTQAYEIVHAELTDQIRHRQKVAAKTAAMQPATVSGSEGDKPTQADPSITVDEVEALIAQAIASRDDCPELAEWAASGWSIYLRDAYGRKPLIDTTRRALKTFARRAATKAEKVSPTDRQISDLYTAVHNAVVCLNREGNLETADALGWGSLRRLLADLITARDAIKRECGRREKVPA